MRTTTLNQVLLRSTLSAALGLALAGLSSGALAQSAAGSLFGRTQAGATVTIENLDTGTSREISADANGRFSASQLPTGRYRVSSGGQSREISVVVGTGSSVNFTAPPGDATTLDVVTVVGGRINPIDVSSVESTTVFSQAQIQALPVASDVTNVALLAPGTVQGDTGFGNLASFGGSSVAENGYFINGFDVTNIRNFTSYASLPFDAIGEQQIKTGGYGAEFGRSLGGVINLVTRRGSNEWRSGFAAYWTPAALREEGRDVDSRNPKDLAGGRRYSQFRSANEYDRLSYNAYLSGPIVKDRLFFFVLGEGNRHEDDTFGDRTSTARRDTTPRALAKLDWNITDNHLLELTAIRNKEQSKYRLYNSDTLYADSHGELYDDYTVENGGDVYIGRYTGFLTDNFTLSLTAGRLKNVDNWRTTPPKAADCPWAYDSRTGGLIQIGCWTTALITDRSFGPNQDEREAYRLDAEWQVGDHLLRFGYDDETFTSSNAGQTYSGGVYYRYFSDTQVRIRRFESTSGSYEVSNTAAYIEDNWKIGDNWLLYLGLRSESFDNRNGTGESFVKAENLLAPRLGFAWDVRGDSSFKIYGNAGRYFIPVAANTNVRASGGEQTITEYYTYTGIDPLTGAPITLGDRVSGPTVSGSLIPADPRTIATTDLDPMYQDEFILGAQWALKSWVFGAKAVYRQVRNGMDDYCSHSAFEEWAADNGHTNFDSSTMATCFMMNPGRDVRIALDLENDGNLSEVVVPNRYLGLPEYKRKYSALELTVERPKQDGLFLQGSYTYAKSMGNIEGYVNSSLEQDDAGLTQDFDNRYFEDGAYGPLPNDRRHTLKLFGSYDLSDQWVVSGNLLVQSGRPVNCQGYVPMEQLGPSDRADLETYSASSFYCLQQSGLAAPGSRELRQRGSFGRTPWTNRFDLGVAYTPNWARDRLQLKVDVFNLFNNHAVTERNEAGELTRVADTGDIDRDDDRSEFIYERNPNFLNDVNYQSPRYVRFSVRYTW